MSCPVPHDKRQHHPLFKEAMNNSLASSNSGGGSGDSDGSGKAQSNDSTADKNTTTQSMCPVPHERRANHPLFKVSSQPEDVDKVTSPNASISETSVVLDPATSANMMHAPNQRPAPGQRWALPTARQRSTIPRGEFVPGHQEDKEAKKLAEGDGEDNWVYPSQQMFFNAMNRKGWNPKEEDMPVVIKIHNAVNERTWMEVMKWEAMHSECTNPKLYKFMGRPKDLSPKARVNAMMGYKKPFDRHDWIVDRCGDHIRYIIDFYEGNVDRSKDGRQGFFLDTRPALDSFGAVFDRARMWWKRL